MSVKSDRQTRGRKGALVGALIAVGPALYFGLFGLAFSDSGRWQDAFDGWELYGLLVDVALILGLGALIGRLVGRVTAPRASRGDT
jgi:hypothetical protein